MKLKYDHISFARRGFVHFVFDEREIELPFDEIQVDEDNQTIELSADLVSERGLSMHVMAE